MNLTLSYAVNDTAQVGAEVSEYLGIPNVSNVLSIESVDEDNMTVTASLDDRIVTMNVKLPCLISADGDINTPRLPSYKVKQGINKDVVKFISLNDLNDRDASHYGLMGSATQVERIFPPEKTKERLTITGTAEEQSDAIFDLICRQKLI